ncbi:MFS transporter [Candidatus Micrarchaeota archaeon]|nr:MFS transporter [Candidatus Micrarchaeota archaeon]
MKLNPLFESTILDAFFSAAFSLIIPLLLSARGVDISVIGIIFAITPIVFQTMRLGLSIFADSKGAGKLFLLNAILFPINGLVFLFSYSVPFFLLGKFIEGLRSASLVAVGRSIAFNAIRRDSSVTTALYALSSVSTAMGMLAVGVALAFLSLSDGLLLFSILSLAMFHSALRMKGVPAREVRKLEKPSAFLDWRFKPPVFRKVMLAMTLLAVNDALIFAYVLPLFLNFKGLDFRGVGLHLGAFALVSGVVSLFLVANRKHTDMRKLLSCQLVVGTLGFAVLPFAGLSLLLPAIILLAVGDGITRVLFEGIVLKAVAGSKLLSIDIGILHMPFHFVRAAALLAAGFLVNWFGFQPVFLLAAAFFAAYSLSIRRFYY